MRALRTILLLSPVLVAACAANPDKRTLAELRGAPVDVTEIQVEDGLERAMQGYGQFLQETPESALTPEAMRRLADLKVEKEYGLLGTGEIVELEAPEPAAATSQQPQPEGDPSPAGLAAAVESDRDFEQRASGDQSLATPRADVELQLPGSEEELAWEGPLEAIELYKKILETYPSYEHNDQVLYQMARAHDELGQVDEAMVVMERLVSAYPHSRYVDEVQFRRAEYFFTRRMFVEAEHAYSAIIGMGVHSSYYELALYKLGWTFYKQDFYDEALHNYVALLDYKVLTGYDFDQSQEEADERRVADTFRVISLSFSNLGGAEVVQEYFAEQGNRGYEDRIYGHLGEFYIEKRRYDDAAKVYKSFVDLYPLHRVAPHFSMRVVGVFEAGDFPKLVVEAKKEFATRYGLRAEYWRHFDINESPEVLSYLKGNLADLANHYHALYQEETLAEEQPANYQEALQWYSAYLESFPADPETPAINYQLADLHLEQSDFEAAALQYERTAYDYPAHAQAPAAGYAAIFAHRESQKGAQGSAHDDARRLAVESTLKFAATFPEHEHAAVVLGAAADDLYEMQDYLRAIESARTLIDRYPDAEQDIRRAAWLVVGHSSFDLAQYPDAEYGYAQVLGLLPAADDSRQAVVDNLAAAIYKQGEQANLAEDYRAAADHFLRVSQAAPTSSIRPAAEYDAGAALMRLEDWGTAAAVLESFRTAYPEHELQGEATKQIAFVYREDGQLSRAAAEYERIAEEAEEAEMRREALLLAGELYEEAKVPASALTVYLRYVELFPRPLGTAIETRFKIATMYKATNDQAPYFEQLREIVAMDGGAGDERSDRSRYLAAQSALVLAEDLYLQFEDVRLVQPFERSLQQKQKRMDAAMEAFGGLVDYEVAEVTAAATFYMAEVYFGFSDALIKSERPTGLDATELDDYEMVIEEEAFPFEEQAIEVHEKNLELMVGGIFNSWVEKSLDRLADLMPGRYAIFEISSGFLGSIDSYAYRSPRPPDTAIEEVEEEGGESSLLQEESFEESPADLQAVLDTMAAR
jgi:TolA-binding protein